MSGFTFGTNTANQPAQNTGFSFGAPKTSAAGTTFGAPALGSNAPTFGTPSLGAAAPAFGAQTMVSTAPTFGTTTLGAAAPTFGAPAMGTNAPAFGAPALGASAPTFGAPAAGTAAPAFGAPTLGSAAPSFGTTTMTSTAPAFGAAPMGSTAPTFATATLGATAPAGSFSFGGAQSTSMGATTTTTAALPTFGLGGGGTSSFNFGTKPTATAAPTSASLNFGTTTSSAPTFALGGGGLFGKPATTATAPTPFVGLGGADVSSSQPKTGDSKQDHVKVKETQVPDEIAKTVDSLKSYIKAQKTLSSDIGRTSTSKLTNVSNEIANLQWSLQEISNSVEANYNQIKLLRKETTRTIQSVEMAQRTQDTPSGLQFENTVPFQYFQNLVAKYEQDLCNFRQQIALTERHMRSLANPQTVSPADLKRGFQQINESFISLAGRLHEIHQKVEQQKEQFINLRKYRLRDGTNVFAKIDNPETTKVDTSRVTAGPTPFSNITAMTSFGKSFLSASGATGAGAGSVQLPK